MPKVDDWIDRRVLAARAGLELTDSVVERLLALLRGDLRGRQLTHSELANAAAALIAEMETGPSSPDSTL